MLSDRSVNRFGSESCWSRRNSESATAFGSAGSFAPRVAATSTMRSQRRGVRTTRRSDAKSRSSRKRAVDAVGGDHQVLDDARGRGSCRRAERDDLAVLRDGTRFGGLELERAVLDATTTKAPRRLLLHEQLIGERGVLRDLGRRLAATIEPRSDVLVDELRVVRRRARYTSDAMIEPSGAIVMSVTTARRSTPASSDVTSLDSSSGSIGKRRDAGVERRGVRRGVAIEGRLLRDEHVDVGDADPHADRAVGEALRDLDLIEVGRLAVVDRRPEQLALVAHVCGIARGRREALPRARREGSRR